MKIPTQSFYAAIAASILAASASTALAQTTATTDPVGFFTATLAGSSGGGNASRTLSVPLYRASVYSAGVTEVIGSTCRLSGATFGTGSGQTDVASSTNPHLLRVKNSSNSAHIGKFVAISAQSGDQLTLTSAIDTFVSVGDSCEVVPANTLGSVFGTANPPMTGWVTATSAATADKVYLWNPVTATWDIFFYHSTNNRWQQSGALGSKNAAIIYPDDGAFISRVGSTPISLVTTGTVPTTLEQSDLNSGSTCLANRFPVDVQLKSVGLDALPGWVKNTSATGADTVYIWNTATSTWDVFFYHSTNNRWQQSGALGSKDTFVITAGTAMFVKRSSASTVSLTQTLPYTP